MPKTKPSLVYVIDDDCDLGSSIARLLRRSGLDAEPFVEADQLLEAHATVPADCILTDIMMGDLDGFAFAERLRGIDEAAAIVFMTAWPRVRDAVDSIRRHGGIDYLEKPIDEDRLLAAVSEASQWSRRRRLQLDRTARLTPRERQVFALLVRGMSNKAIAAELNLSPKTIEDHRAQINAKTGTSGLAQLMELARAP